MIVRATVALMMLASCAAGPALQPAARGAVPAAVARSSRYQPLAVGDSWTYTCRDIKGGGENENKPFLIVNKVLGYVKVGGRKDFEFVLRIPEVPSKPLKIATRVMLLNDDASGNLRIYGYLIHGVVHRVTPATIVSSVPVAGTYYDYPGPAGLKITRYLYGVEASNPTPLGTFTVADYEESSTMHDYGYAKGVGIAEEDHGPNFQVDCLIEKLVLR